MKPEFLNNSLLFRADSGNILSGDLMRMFRLEAIFFAVDSSQSLLTFIVQPLVKDSISAANLNISIRKL